MLIVFIDAAPFALVTLFSNELLAWAKLSFFVINDTSKEKVMTDWKNNNNNKNNFKTEVNGKEIPDT